MIFPEGKTCFQTFILITQQQYENYLKIEGSTNPCRSCIPPQFQRMHEDMMQWGYNEIVSTNDI